MSSAEIFAQIVKRSLGWKQNQKKKKKKEKKIFLFHI